MSTDTLHFHANLYTILINVFNKGGFRMARERVSLADKAYDIIKTNIINLTYPPGMQLTEALLTEELGMSRNPVRTALKMLESEGLIVSDYYKSMIVKEISEEDINNIYQLRELLEGAAFKQIFDLGRAEEFSYRIEEKVVRMCASAHDIFAWEVADANMHMEIVSIFDNERINKFYETNLAELIRMGMRSVKNGMQIDKTNENLKQMVLYMRENNYEKSFEILKNDHFKTGKITALSE